MEGREQTGSLLFPGSEIETRGLFGPYSANM